MPEISVEMWCNICPRECNVDRDTGRGFCSMGENPVVAKAFLHMWEEPCISGTKGSGAVFFSGCNLKCIFCQNHEISHGGYGKEITAEELAGIFLSLQNEGAHNINLVTPSHFVTAVRHALTIAKDRLSSGQSRVPLQLPVIYNTNGYDKLETLHSLDGFIDIYLPDLKYVDSEISADYSGVRDYFETASKAILEMYRQVGPALFDEDGMMKRGMIIRHLVLPGHTNDSLRVLEWIKENMAENVYVSLMSQYIPCHLACGHRTLGRSLTRYEHEKVIHRFEKLGLNGFVQEREAASAQYIPDFIE